MKNNKKTTIKCDFGLYEFVHKPTEEHLLKGKQKWSDYVKQLILKDSTQLKRGNKKLKK